MRYATFEHNGQRRVGSVEGENIRPFSSLTELGQTTTSQVLSSAAKESHTIPIADVHLLPPVPNPGKIICVGLNYMSHIEETHRSTNEYPVFFPKYASSLVGAFDDILLPPESHQMDYEAELAVVMGTSVRRIDEEHALEAVLGYTVANDVTMRDYQYKTHQWMQGKAWDRATPVGPYLVEPSELSGLDLNIRLEVNGLELQSSRTGRLIFSIPRLIATVSEFTQLDPGDMILTGTPSGVGFRRDPPVFLRSGDVVVTEIGGVGRLCNHVRAEHQAPEASNGGNG